MEIAFNALQHTVTDVKEYLAGTDRIPEVLRCYCTDISEDISTLDKFKATYNDRATEFQQLIADAKQYKRDAEKLAHKLVTEAKRALPTGAPIATPHPASFSASTKLPKIQLPFFDGETTDDYRGFKQAFDETIALDPMLSEVRKWLLLRAQLKGRALELVQDLPISPEAYASAIRILDQAYGSTKRAVMNLYQKLQELPDASMDTESLRLTNAKIDGMLNSLQGLGVKLETEDFLRAVVLSKYPIEVMHQLKVNDDMTLDTFRKDVTDYIQLRGYSFRRSTTVTAIKAEQPVTRHQNNGSSHTNGSGNSNGYGNGQPNGNGRAEGSKKQRHSYNANFTSGGSSTKDAPPSQVKTNSITAKKQRTRPHACIFCSGDHWSDNCDKFLTADERRQKILDRCQKCLRPAHAGTDCHRWQGCCYCKEHTHNRAICPKQFPSAQAKVLVTQTFSEKSKPSEFITALIPISNISKANKASVRSILDTGGGKDLATADLVEQLQLQALRNRRIRLTTANKTTIDGSAKICKILIYPLKGKPVEIEVCIVDNIVDDVTSTDVTELKQRYPQYANLNMPLDGNGQRVQLLLGYKTMAKLVTLEKSIKLNDDLQLMGTRMGWIPFGLLPESHECSYEEASINIIRHTDPIKLMCDLEAVGLADLLTSENEEEMLAAEKIQQTMQRLGKQYQVEWPYKYDPPDLNDNFGLALGRLNSLYRQLAATPQMLIAYDKIIRDQVEEDIVEIVNTRRKLQPTRVHYLPHRGIIRFGKSTPIRIVFDASARCGKHARSLNDNILKGGNWVNDLPGILLRFRRYGLAITSDIAKAFHQILIAPKDRDVVRFLWLRDINKPPTPDNLITYRFKRVAFGIIASPFILSATIKHHLREFPNKYAEQIQSDMYADNLLVSLPKTADGEEFYRIVKSCFAEMSMNITQWTTDSENLRSKFGEADRVIEDEQSALGLRWNTRNKTMGVKNPNLPILEKTKITKRLILKESATVYDPLGWVAPLLVSAKILLRKIWLLGHTWDEILPAAIQEEWFATRQQLNRVDEIDVQRAYGFNGLEEATKIELHAFCDASQDAYGVVVYLRVIHNRGAWTGIVASKSKLAPKAKLSIPRLELLAAAIATKYVLYIQKMLQIEDIDKYLWGDSRCVISWVQTRKLLPAAVEKTAQTIRNANFVNFLHVPTAENPADVLSRGAQIDALKEQNWWTGPTWLHRKDIWPQQQTCNAEKELQNSIEQLHVEEQRIMMMQAFVAINTKTDPDGLEGAPFDFNPSDFPTLGQLLRKTAYCITIASRFLRGKGKIPQDIGIDYVAALHRWIRWDQQRMYQPATSPKSNISYLRNLPVEIDEDGLIRYVTRMEWGHLSRDEAQPILLAKGTRLTTLIVLTTHINNMHAGTAHTLASLRKKYWLPHGRRETYRIITKFCFKCRRNKAQPFQPPPMAPLPEFRITRTERPFENIGVDVFGPYKIRVKQNDKTLTQKHWVIVFTCLAIRAIHLEIMVDMTAEEFLRAFKKFAGRRGVPKIIVSDNAPQFKVVDGIFRCLWRRFSSAESTTKYYAEHGIQWKFLPPESPWMGGAYERVIKSIKTAFDITYGDRILTDKEFEVAVVEIEAMVNNRPITYVDKEAESEIITPNDFLQLRYPAFAVDFTRVITPTQLTNSWKKAEQYLDEFWRIWSERYLHQLKERRDVHKASTKSDPQQPQPGEVVIIVDPEKKRSAWKTAIVERLLPGTDGKIRSVQIRLAEKADGKQSVDRRPSQHIRMIRPINKLASLKLFTELPANLPELTADQSAIVVDNQPGVIEV